MEESHKSKTAVFEANTEESTVKLEISQNDETRCCDVHTAGHHNGSYTMKLSVFIYVYK